MAGRPGEPESRDAQAAKSQDKEDGFMRKNQGNIPRRQEDGSLGMLLLVWLYRLLLISTMAAGICLIGTLPVQVGSAEFVAVLIAYAMLLVVMQGVYRACAAGQARISELVMSQILANLVTLGMLFVGVALYTHSLFNPLPLLGVLVGQILLGCLWSVLANRCYFRNRRPSRAAVIYSDEQGLQKLIQTPYFQERYEVCKRIACDGQDIGTLREEVRGCEILFTVGVPATLTNGIAKLCLEMDLEGYFIPHLGHIILSGAEYMSTFSVPMLRVQRAGGHSEYRVIKRLFDFCASLVAVVVTLPIMAVTALAIWLEDRGPVLYRQVRLTKNGREFRILKFRSMNVNAEQDGIARLAGENDIRITKVGRFIRSCRIDELPQLFNILKGDMSIVGPRPERPEIAELYQKELPEFALRLQVKAGLTGLAQVYGRYSTEPYNKLQMDLMYINEMSFLRDLQLMLMTVKILFMKESARGVTRDQAATRETSVPKETRLRA